MKAFATRDRYLVDEMLTHAELIAVNVKRGRDAFETDPTIRYAVEHATELIAEAAEKTSRGFKTANPLVPWDLLREQCRVSAHPYDVGAAPQNVEKLWRFARDDVPAIVRRLRKATLPSLRGTGRK